LCWQGKRYHNNQKSPNQQKDHGMIGQILSSVTGLATSWLDSKAQQKLLETEIRKKQLTGEIDWELKATRSAQNSWKDELRTIVFVCILAANFVPSLQDAMARGFANLETTPLWVQWGMYASIAASFGIRTMRGLKKWVLEPVQHNVHEQQVWK
jgi:hypothetical protein